MVGIQCTTTRRKVKIITIYSIGSAESAPLCGYGPRLGISWKEIKIRWRGNLILGILDAFGGKTAPKGILRRHQTISFVLKQAEKNGWYD